MREVDVSEVSEAVERLFIEASLNLPRPVAERLEKALGEEASPEGKEVIAELLENARVAAEEGVPICQDTGLAVVFVEVGQDVHLVGGDLRAAIDAGVRNAYLKEYLRKSCCDPFTRRNTGDNTPAIVHLSIVPGERVRVVAMPKGGGSENYSEVRMLTPSAGVPGIKSFIMEMIKKGGPNPCPPVTVGVGIGGNFETAALLSKEALMVPYGRRHPDPLIAGLETDLLADINRTGIGPGGYGGTVTALDVHIRTMACHIASLPVAVNVQCHANRAGEAAI